MEMNNRQLAQLQRLLKPNKRGRKQARKFAFPPLDTADELRERYGSVELALSFIPLGIGAFQYRCREGLFPEEDRWMLDYLLTNDLKTLTGVEIPQDYQTKAQHLANRSRSHN
jgi:hypothetical protein